MTDEAMSTSCRFTVEGNASADLPVRLLNLFAQQDLTYDRVAIVRTVDRYAITIDHSCLPRNRADILLEKMRAMVLVSYAEKELLGEDV